MCEVLLPDEPHPTNTRAPCRDRGEVRSHDPLFGIEQEYTFFDGRPLGFPAGGFPAPQGGYYCGVGADEVFGRAVVEAHLEECLAAGLQISGINAEVMPGQWEFQVGPVGPLEVSDQLGSRAGCSTGSAEDFDISATLDPKPVKGDWNGAGCHTNFSTVRDADDLRADRRRKALGHARPDCTSPNYGVDIEQRLTGHARDRPYNEFCYGVSTVAHRCESRGRWTGRQGLHRRPSARTRTWIRTSSPA